MSSSWKNQAGEEKKAVMQKNELHLNINSKTYNDENIIKLTAEVEGKQKNVKTQNKSNFKGSVTSSYRH